MIHQIRPYMPDGKIYMSKSCFDDVVDKTLEYDVAFSIDFKITSNHPQPQLKTNMRINLMRIILMRMSR